MRAQDLVLSGAVVVVVAAFGAACMAPSIPNEGLSVQYQTAPDPKEDAGAKDSMSPIEPSSPSPSQADASTAPASTVCAKEQKKHACYDCCDNANPKALAFLDAEWKKCVCAPAACAVQCGAELCAGQPVTSKDCDLCLGDAEDACDASAKTACASNADCAALAACAKDSDCASK